MIVPPLLRALRPAQWTKNLLVFAGVVFAGRLGDPAALARAIAAFALFSAASSAVYLANDLVDREEDRRHPRKRLRPVASGEVAPATAAALAAALGLGALAGGAALGRPFLGSLVAYLSLHVFYVAWGRGVAVLDVVLVALGFVLRAVAGAVAVAVPYSPWLLVTTFLGALLVALGKRRAEAAAGAPGRPSLEGLPLPVLDAAISASAGALLIAYALYTILSPTATAGVGAEPTPHLFWTFPVVCFGVLRYILLVHAAGGAAEEPEEILLADRPVQAALVVWIALVVALLYGGR